MSKPVLAALVFVAAACGAGVASKKLSSVDDSMTGVERQLAAGGVNTALCMEYVGLCEQGLALCLEGNNAQTYQSFCAGLQQRCNTTVDRYCREAQPDGGSSVDAGTRGPTISAVAATNITQTSATITWTLSAPATGQVEFGLTTAYGQLSVKETSFNYSAHQQQLSGLTASSLYHFRVRSTDQAGAEAVSADFTFTSPGAGTFVAPALVNPGDPMRFGAKCDGATDDTAAFQAALNAGDVLVPAGKTCVINGTVTIQVSNRHLECGRGAILQQTIVGGRMFWFLPASGSDVGDAAGGFITGDSIVNCHFIGSNSVAPRFELGAKQWNIPVMSSGTVDNLLLAGNTFERFWGQSMFQTYAHTNGGSGDQIIYNTFKSCGYYGPVFASTPPSATSPGVEDEGVADGDAWAGADTLEGDGCAHGRSRAYRAKAPRRTVNITGGGSPGGGRCPPARREGVSGRG